MGQGHREITEYISYRWGHVWSSYRHRLDNTSVVNGVRMKVVDVLLQRLNRF